MSRRGKKPMMVPYLVVCKYCLEHVIASNYDNHLKLVHKCKYCENYMPKQSLAVHIKRVHECSSCGNHMRKEALTGHINRCHLGKVDDCLKRLETAIGNSCANLANIENLANVLLQMIRLDKLTNDEFNKLLDENRIYAKDGHLFRK